ncbi:hypothetical protein PLICRDRAFT_53482 [Plicaturopsis crispa FD-325 SS-3]|nr:hypothetical protein PLICRDRAFT_53482 [Plicaturopsis crispa FD-325 SS-3]
MSVNDKDPFIGGNKGVETYPGVANPTSGGSITDPLAANFVTDPTTEDTGAGAGPKFEGGRQAQRGFAATAGVVEGRPGIIESTNIDPLNENSNKDDGWANSSSGVVDGSKSVASGAASVAYGTVTGNEAAKQAGKEQIYGK